MYEALVEASVTAQKLLQLTLAELQQQCLQLSYTQPNNKSMEGKCDKLRTHMLSLPGLMRHTESSS